MQNEIALRPDKRGWRKRVNLCRLSREFRRDTVWRLHQPRFVDEAELHDLPAHVRSRVKHDGCLLQARESSSNDRPEPSRPRFFGRIEDAPERIQIMTEHARAIS